MGRFGKPETLIDILWQCDVAVAVDKPAGLSTTSPPGTDSLESFMRRQLGRENEYVTAVHRLDRDVSGVVLLALTKKSARLLSQQFAARRVRKTYLAWVNGNVAQTQSFPENLPAATIRWTDHVRKLPDVARGEVCSPESPGAKKAETEIAVVHYDRNADCTLLRLSPLTGRMHQLRLQTASRGHAILADPIYAAPTKTLPQHPQWQFDTIALAATQLTFHHPRTGVLTEVLCDRLTEV